MARRPRRPATLADVLGPPSERETQRAILQLIQRQYPQAGAWHVPNGARMTMGEAKKMKADGMRRGLPDLWVMWPGGFVWIEVKRPGWVPSDVSEAQCNFIIAAAAAGVVVEVAGTPEEAAAILARNGCPIGR